MKDLDRAGVNKWYNKARNLWYLGMHSDDGTGDGELDFVVVSEIHGTYLNPESKKPKGIGFFPTYLYMRRNHLNGKYVAHNIYNFGNYMWGAAANALEVSLQVAIAGAHINNRYIDKHHLGTWDRPDDQLSIKLGWTWRK